MTAKNAERITGMVVRQIDYGGRVKAYGLYLPDSNVELFASHSSPPSEALSRIVELNYQRVKRQVFTEQNWRCWHCFRLGVELQADHIKPRSKGRCDDRLNLRGVCPTCHMRITAGDKLNPHPRMAELMSNIGLRWIGNYECDMTPCGWERTE